MSVASLINLSVVYPFLPDIYCTLLPIILSFFVPVFLFSCDSPVITSIHDPLHSVINPLLSRSCYSSSSIYSRSSYTPRSLTPSSPPVLPLCVSFTPYPSSLLVSIILTFSPLCTLYWPYLVYRTPANTITQMPSS